MFNLRNGTNNFCLLFEIALCAILSKLFVNCCISSFIYKLHFSKYLNDSSVVKGLAYSLCLQHVL